MSQMILRQCQSLTGVHYNGIQCYAREIVRRSIAPGLVRRYVNAAPSDDKPSPALRLSTSAILIPRSVKNIRPVDLLDRITPLPRDEIARNNFCVFLITPAFATWMLDETALGDHTFLAQAVHRVYTKGLKRKTGHLQVQVLCAVVDKVPAGKSLKPGASLQEEIEQFATGPPVDGTGFEGIAYATFPSTASKPSAFPGSQDKGAIDFTLATHTPGEEGTLNDMWRLPLANTVFQTGRPTTMSISSWDLNLQAKTPILLKRRNISHHGINLSSTPAVSRTSSVLSIALSPLTFPRTADGCMGNIIRRVIGPEGESITASSELEKVVPQFYQARSEPARPTTVWALVIPKAKIKQLDSRTRRLLGMRIAKSEKGTDAMDVLWKRLWQAEDPWTRNTLVTTAIAEGARLHRVLSGGGGWGKKAGLLSLDPVPVTEEVPIQTDDATSEFSGPGDFSEALTPVLRDGDAIQFFISPGLHDQLDDDKKMKRLKLLARQGAGGVQLGTVPSTIDSVPGQSQQHIATDDGYVAVFKNSFGALTEAGLTLTRRLTPQDQNQRPVLTTMIDVPYSRLWSVGLEDGEGSTKHVETAEVQLGT
ncbi:hypothetical protein DE146DRAFT_295650 [Phaeosphaeria sp. MPI-PUGE-AT-0046c]|nr:hypothetical protein DE146DRAFT_295650 [Phaeosphaeria sp. MPI-PUGE-AT-0046c]